MAARLMMFLAHFSPFVKTRASGKPITTGTEGSMERVGAPKRTWM